MVESTGCGRAERLGAAAVSLILCMGNGDLVVLAARKLLRFPAANEYLPNLNVELAAWKIFAKRYQTSLWRSAARSVALKGRPLPLEQQAKFSFCLQH